MNHQITSTSSNKPAPSQESFQPNTPRTDAPGLNRRITTEASPVTNLTAIEDQGADATGSHTTLTSSNATDDLSSQSQQPNDQPSQEGWIASTVSAVKKAGKAVHRIYSSSSNNGTQNAATETSNPADVHSDNSQSTTSTEVQNTATKTSDPADVHSGDSQSTTKTTPPEKSSNSLKTLSKIKPVGMAAATVAGGAGLGAAVAGLVKAFLLSSNSTTADDSAEAAQVISELETETEADTAIYQAYYEAIERGEQPELPVSPPVEASEFKTSDAETKAKIEGILKLIEENTEFPTSLDDKTSTDGVQALTSQMVNLIEKQLETTFNATPPQFQGELIQNLSDSIQKQIDEAIKSGKDIRGNGSFIALKPIPGMDASMVGVMNGTKAFLEKHPEISVIQAPTDAEVLSTGAGIGAGFGAAIASLLTLRAIKRKFSKDTPEMIRSALKKAESNSTAKEQSKTALTETGQEQSKTALTETGQEQSKTALTDTGQEQSKTALTETGQEQSKTALTETGQEQTETALTDTGQEQSKTALTETGQEQTETALTETGQEQTETALTETGQEQSKTALTETGQEQSKTALTETGQEQSKTALTETGQEQSKTALTETGQEQTETALTETGQAQTETALTETKRDQIKTI